MNQHLAYGDIIRIYCTLQDIQDRKTSSKISGFLVSKGFADNNIYFLKSKRFTQFQLRNSLFEILPYSSFDIHDQKKNSKNNEKSKDMQNIQSRMDTEKDQFQNKCRSVRGSYLNFDTQVIIRHVNSGSYLQGEFSCPETGIGSFKIILSDELSSLIKFKIIRFRNSDKEAEEIQSKDQFRLYHCASHCYLNLGDQNHEIFLDKDISIKEIDVPNFQKSDQAHIYMHIRPSIKKPFNIQQNDNNIKRYQVVNQSKATLILNFLPEKKCTKTIAIQEQSKIQHNDVVYIKNTKNNSYLVADLWTGQINMKAVNGSKKNDLPYEGLWQVCIHRDSQKGASVMKDYFLKHYITDMIVRIQSNSNGEQIKINEQELLNSEKNAKVIRLVNYPEGSNNLKHRSLILLQKYTFHYERNINKRSSKRRLSFCGNVNVGDSSAPKQYLDISKKVSKIYMNKLQEKIDENQQIFKLDLRKDSIENTFQIFKFDKNKLKSINKILSCVETLTKFCDILINFNKLFNSEMITLNQQCKLDKKQFEEPEIHETDKSIIHQDKTKQKQVSKIQQFFSNYVNYYILNVVIYTIKYLKNNAKTGSKIEFDFIKMMQSLGMVQIIVQNIYFLDRTFKSIKYEEDFKKQIKKTNKDILSKRKYQRDRLNQVFKQMYTLLTFLAQQNQCRLYITKWLDLYLNQFYTYKEDYIHEFLLQLLKQQFINKNCITNIHIKQCIDELINADKSENLKYTKQDIPNYKFLQLLSGFCCTKKTAVPQHQNFIINEFIAKNKFIYKFDTKNIEDNKDRSSHSSQKSHKKQKIRIKLRGEGNDDSDYILMSDHTKFKRKQLWTYIIFLLNLVADLSFQQSRSSAILQEVVNLQVIKSFFKSYGDQDTLKQDTDEKSKSNNIYLPFLKLAHYFFINIHEVQSETYLTRLVRNQIITSWDEPTQSMNSICNNPLRDLTGNVRTFFSGFFQKQLNINQYDINRLKTTETTLEFIKTVIKYSSWEEQNKKLIPLIIYSVTKLKSAVILKDALENGVVNKGKIKQNVKKLRSDKQILRLLIDNRNIATEILDIRMDIINNIRLVQLTKFFKKFYQNNIDTGKGQYFSRMENELMCSKIETPSIWTKQITKNCETDLMLISKAQLIKCLVQCTFVDSLKIVGKILNIIFKLYESKKILIERFKQNFILQNTFFLDIFRKGKQWIANFERSRDPDGFFEVIKSLKLFSDAIRKPKMDNYQNIYSILQEKLSSNRNIILNQFETKFTDPQKQMQKFLSNLKIHEYLIKFSNKQLFSLNRNIRQNLDYIYQYLTLLIFDNPRNKRILSSNIDFTFKHIKYNTKCIDFLSQLFRNNKKLLFDKQIITRVCNLVLEEIKQSQQRAHENRAKLMSILRIFCIYNQEAHQQNQKLVLNLMQNKRYADKVIFSTKQFEQDQHNKKLYRNLIKQIQQNIYSDSESSLENMNKYLIQQQSLSHNNSNFQQINHQQTFNHPPQKARTNKYDYIQQGINQFIENTEFLYTQPSQFYQEPKVQDIYLPPVILQLMTYFCTMSALVQGRNEINIGKCSNMHSYQSLLFVLYFSRRCWPLVRYIRGFINKLYYIGVAQEKTKEASLSEKSYKTTLINKQIDLKPQLFIETLFKMQIPLLKLSLKQLSKIYLEQYDRYQNIKVTNPIRYQYFNSYIYYTFLETLYSILKIFSSIQFQTALQIRINQVYKQKDSSYVKKIIQNIGVVYKSSRASNLKQIKLITVQLSKICCNIIKHIDNSRLQHIQQIEFNSLQLISTSVSNYQLSRGLTINKSQRQKFDVTQKQDTSLDKSVVVFRTLLDGNKNNQKYLFMKKHFIEENQNKNNFHVKQLGQTDSVDNQQINDTSQSKDLQTQINQQLQRVNNSLANSHQVKDMIEKQFDQLVELCCNLDKIFQNVQNNEPAYKIIGQKQFLIQIIKLVTKSPPHLTLQNKIKSIKLLRMIFQKKVNNQMNFQNRTVWCSYHFQSQQQQKILQYHQHNFKQMNLSGMIVAILKQQTTSYELLLETFLIGVSLLYNGNSECQKQILQHLKNDTENLVIMQLHAFIKKIKIDILNNKFVLPKQNNFNITQNQQKIEKIFIDCLEYYDRDLRCMIQAKSQEDTIIQSTHEIQIKIQCVCKAYNFLQLLCENDNIELKNFLRQQLNSDKSVKYNSINILTQTSKLFQIVLEIFDSQVKNNVILNYIAEFFIQVTQIPCIQNQRQLVSTSIFNDIKSYYYQNKLEQSKSISYLLDFVVNAGLSLLQGDDDDIYQALIFAFDSQFLFEIFLYQKNQLEILNRKNPECPLFECINKHTLKILVQQDLDLQLNINIKKRLNSLFKLLSFVKKLSIYQQQKKEKTQKIVLNNLIQVAKKYEKLNFHSSSQTLKSMTEVIQDLSNNYLLHIEVFNQNKKQFIYFPNLPIFQYISEETKNYILYNVKRDKQIDKITQFISKSVEVNQQMNWNYKVENRISISSNSLDIIRRNILFLTIFIQILYVVFSHVLFVQIDDKMQIIKTVQFRFIRIILHALCILQLFATLYFIYIWTILKYRLSLQRQLQSQTLMKQQEIKIMLSKIDEDQDFQFYEYILCLRVLAIHQIQIFNIFFFFSSSILGYLFGCEYYSLLVFDILARNQTLQNVIQAITRNLKQLFFVSLLIFSFVYIFNLLSIEFDLYLPHIYLQGEQKCQILSDCIMSLYTSGIVGQKSSDFKMFRFFTDLIYVIIMELLFSNIISGIMIDTFAQLRDSRKTKQADQKNICFICGISKAALQKKIKQNQYIQSVYQAGDIFQTHITKIHYQWNYLFYLYILAQKDKTEYTGIQYMIHNQHKQDRYDWIPTEYEQNESQVEKLLDAISSKIHERDKHKKTK